jgi:hypothetical protein
MGIQLVCWLWVEGSVGYREKMEEIKTKRKKRALAGVGIWRLGVVT